MLATLAIRRLYASVSAPSFPLFLSAHYATAVPKKPLPPAQQGSKKAPAPPPPSGKQVVKVAPKGEVKRVPPKGSKAAAASKANEKQKKEQEKQKDKDTKESAKQKEKEKMKAAKERESEKKAKEKDKARESAEKKRELAKQKKEKLKEAADKKKEKEKAKKDKEKEKEKSAAAKEKEKEKAKKEKEQENKEKEKQKKAVDKEKKDAYPTRVSTPFMMFMNDSREAIKKEHPDIKFTEIAGEASKRWKALSPDKKAKYDKLRNQDKARFQKDLAAYKLKYPDPPKRSASAYNIFFKDAIVEQKQKTPNAAFTEMFTNVATKWTSLSPQDKKKYTDLAAKDKARYDKEREQWDKKATAAK